MSTSLRCTGIYQDIPVRLIIDPTAAQSLLSSDFASEHHVSLSVQYGPDMIAVRYGSGPFFVPSRTGQYVCLYSLRVDRLRCCDILLGSDWLRLCGVHPMSGFLPDPPMQYRSSLPIGFQWVPASDFAGEYVISHHGICI